MKTCRNCGKDFSSSKLIDGRRRNLRKRVYCLECSPFGTRNRKILEKYQHSVVGQATEKTCGKCKESKAVEQFYCAKNGLSCYCKDCNAIESKVRQLVFKQKCVDYKGGKCEVCGYNKCLASLDFHHSNPNEKDVNVSEIRFRSFDSTTKLELDKCKLLCSNCHRELHAMIFVEKRPYLLKMLESNTEIKYLSGG